MNDAQRANDYYSRIDPDRKRWARAVSLWFKACEHRRRINDGALYKQERSLIYAAKNRRASEAVATAPELFKLVPGHRSPSLTLVLFESPHHVCHETQKGMHVDSAMLEMALIGSQEKESA